LHLRSEPFPADRPVRVKRGVRTPGRQPPATRRVRLRRWGTGQGRQRHPHLQGDEAGTGRVEMTQPMVFSADETTDIGYESGTTVSPRLHRRDQ